MRLKCIKLAGFKSFVDPTTVSFPTDLCAVVGPNGCGKSNIIDAVRWVMGESSAKTLRGESMADVIFNGSSHRKPVSQASIELVFDNSDATITGEYAGFSEISIKRKVTRDGQSEYFLNGAKCRRRDITDIFLGTGLGPRSYAIIEQGMISNLIEAKPDELRVFIEEAAGISKYKERRRDTENRMKRTYENLERLTDIRDELDRQLQHLKRQASAAERYTELKKEERLTKAQLAALQWKHLQEKSRSKHETIDSLELKVEEYVTRQTSLETQIEKHITSHAEFGDEFNAIQAKYYSLGSDIVRVEQTIQHQQDRERQLKSDFERTAEECLNSEKHLYGDREKLQLWEAELEEIAPGLAQLQEAEETSAEVLLQAEETMHDWQHQWDEFNHDAANSRQEAEVQQSKIQQLEQVLKRIEDNTEKLEKENVLLSVGSLQEEIDMLAEQIAETDLQLDDLRQEQGTKANGINELQDQNNSLSNELNDLRSLLQREQGRFASLEALQQAALGRNDNAVNDWLSANQLDDSSRLAQSLKVDEGFEKAIETVLGTDLQAIGVEGLEAAASRIANFEKGRLALFDTLFETTTDDAGEYSTTTAARLLDKVRGQGHLDALIAGVYVADDLNEAMALRKQLRAHESVVTRDGIWVGPGWLRVTRDQDEQAGVIQRQQEMDELSASIEQSEERVEALKLRLESGIVDLRALEESREELQQSAAELTGSHGELRSQLSAKQVRVEQIGARREKIQQEIEDLNLHFHEEDENISRARGILETAIEAMEQDTEQRESLLEARDSNRSALDQARQTARHEKDRAHQVLMRHQSLSTQVESVGEAISRITGQVEQLLERKSELELAIAENGEPLEGLQSELEGQLDRRLSVETNMQAARQKMEAAEQQLRQAESERNKTSKETQEFRSSLEQARLDAQTLDIRSNTLQEQLAEAGFELQTIVEALPEDAVEGELEELLVKLGNRVQRLGAINLAAIDELKQQSERKTYLDAQHEDLTEALETLANAIRKIDKETRTRFRETYDQVNASLQELFPKVFGGGSAYLELTGDDLLDTGITIMARPPGKRNSTIHLLSGGEKALTAIALVFSIFRLNPAPFCMLDEVDAPLDDANIARYANLVEEMSSQVQFIYITHNKIAMEMARQLMGVTMHEPGVSRLVSVDVDAAVELAEA